MIDKSSELDQNDSENETKKFKLETDDVVQVNARSPTDDTGPTCVCCNLTFHTKLIFRLHMKYVHNYSLDDDETNKTNAVTPTLSDDTYAEIQTNRKSSKFKCYVCPQIFVMKKSLRAHLRTHSDGFSCPICKKEFHTYGRFMVHVRSHMNCTTNCDRCNNYFPRIFRYIDHVINNRCSVLVARKGEDMADVCA